MVKKTYYIFSSFAAIILILAIFASANVFSPLSSPKREGRVLGAGDWYDYDWGYRTAITIDNTKVDADLVDFPVLVNSTAADWADTDNGGKVGQADGGDFVFTLSDNITKLSHEIETYDNTTGALTAWVKVPALANASDTVINLYYGNASVDNQWNATDVWTNGYVGVWHLKESGNGTSDEFKDSTSNTNDGQGGAGTGTKVPTQNTSGKIGTGQTFDGSNDYIQMNNFSASMSIPITISWWSRSVGTSISGAFDSSPNVVDFLRVYDNQIQWHNGANVNASVTAGEWTQISVTFKGPTKTVAWYKNGATQVGGSNGAAPTFAWTNFVIGAVNFALTPFNGVMDEMRVSTADRATGWVTTEYNNQNSPATFYSLGVTEVGDTSAPTNPTTASGYDTALKATALTTGNWYSYATPYFEWSGAADGESGLEGYWVYYGTDAAADPVTEGTFQAAADDNYAGSGMVAGSTYYLRMVTENNALPPSNVSAAQTFFTYKYDPTAPAAPEYVNISPVGCSTNTSFAFTWPAGVDTGGSGIAGYDYRRGSTGTIQQTAELTATVTSYQENENIFYVRSRDTAGNTSAWQTAVYCSTASVQVADGPTVTPGPSTMTVAWTSNKNTTSYVRVYQGNDYVSEQGQTSYTMAHSVKVVGLEPEKAYRYKLVWSDSSGNLGESDWYETTTSTAPQINDLKADILGPTSANVSWKDSISATNTIQYGEGAYSTNIDTSGYATTGSYKLENLTSGKTYQLRINATSEDGTKFFAGTSFTMPPLPEISSVAYEITNGGAPGAKVSWKTNVETTSSLFYGVKGSAKTEIATSEKKKEHSINISSLSNSQNVEFYVKGTDVYGNTAESSTLTFSTPADRRPPVISGILTETSNVGLNKQDKAQIIVSWETDEPATAYVEYDNGLSGTEYKQKTTEDKNLSNSHLVIISDLQPSQPYHLRVVSADSGSNEAKSDDMTIIAGDVPKSVFNILVTSFENLFGWLGKLL